MSVLSNTRRVVGVAFSLGVAVAVGSCALSDTDPPAKDPEAEGKSGASGNAGSAGSSNVGGSAQGKAGASGAGGLPGSGGTTSAGGASGSGTGGSVGGGSSGSANLGGMSSGGSNASGGSAGSNSNCVDIPPNNGQGCENAVEFGWCEMEWLGDSCQRTCGKCNGGGSGGSAGSSGGSGGSGTAGSGNTNKEPPPNIDGGQNAWASRYWDCCKPACGWAANAGGTPMKACSEQNQTLGDDGARNACESGGSAFMCWNGAPWQVGERLSYGFAAASGPNYQCGRCFHLQFNGTGHNGNNPGAQSLQGKHMIIQVINNGGVAQDQFDLLIPGGGVGDFDACTRQWGTSDLGARYGGFLLGCNGDTNCVRNKCETIFADKPDLMAGCEWFLGWYNAADNPNFVYERIDCPAEITQRSGLQDR
jgi:hypothetical protein